MMQRAEPRQQAASINPVEPEHGQEGREAAHRSLTGRSARGKDLAQAEPFGKQVMGMIAPVVEIAGDQDRRIGRHQGLDPRCQRIQLLAAGTGKQ